MEQYSTLIGVILEKLDQTYKDLLFNYNGMDGVLQQHSAEERASVPELMTIAELKDVYGELIRRLEERMPGIKD
ncbi:hypothetical protein ACFQ88_15200 [Paenibacillus sp. NPDC056579]|uniref:hypothetical protein n=1 Tax=unclassified Paenibacillus TaxID=185978 RepID=UPI001EF7AFA3|nr:hypothetical protein [Paenibacillus sp. H1-7]ULL17762.1 hypothetical protein DVH26_26875 [Paenibacillus sp. H1-7]